MEYRKLPHGTEKISVIGMGTSVVGENSEQNVVDTVTYALDHGINYFDMAGGHAAIFPGMGKALRGRRREAMLQVHFGADYTSGEYGWNLSLDGVKKSVEWQLKNLQTDYIDFGFMYASTVWKNRSKHQNFRWPSIPMSVPEKLQAAF